MNLPPKDSDKQKPKSNVVHIFSHPAFESTLYQEDDILHMKPSDRFQVYAIRIIELWESKGLRKPQARNREKEYGAAISDLVALMKGNHPRVRTRLTVEQIMQAVKHWAIANFDQRYQPSNKKTYRALNIPRFIYSSFNDRSYLLMYLNPPKTLIREKNPKITQRLIAEYCQARWGTMENNIEEHQHYDFVIASNRLDKFLEENKNRLLLGLSQKNPNRAVYGLVHCATRSKNWKEFKVHWLANDVSFSNLATWLKDQGFFKFNSTSHKFIS
jgi:hypothetical protein